MSIQAARGTAVIIVDVQNDFCEGGALAVSGGAALAAALTAWLPDCGADHVVATRDCHVDPGAHFSDRPDFEHSWPPHCVAGSTGLELHPALATDRIEAVFDKGAYDAAYSGFEGRCDDLALADWLRRHDVTDVQIVGIATDYCVRATAFDAALEGFGTTVRLDLTAAIARATTERALRQLTEVGVTLLGEPHLAA